MNGHPTSRRYARTLAQAFPRDHANPIEHYRVVRIRKRDIAFAIFIGVAFALAVMYGGR